MFNQPKKRFVMNKLFHISRVFIFLVLASFATTALSITVNSESGGASLDGTWAFPGCNLDLEDFDSDYEEFLIFQDLTVESRIVLYTSTDMSCSGVGTIGESEIFDFTDEGDLPTQGWEDGDQPECQDPSNCSGNAGLLADEPLATAIEITIPGEPGEEDEVEIIYWYIDDTGDDLGLSWLLYRNAVDDDEAPIRFMSAEEPLYKTADLSPIPLPAAAWLFGTALIGFVGVSRRRKVA